jgi:hypothetical protein
MKVETTEWRGIKANHYRSCQNWEAIGANFLIDYYFKGLIDCWILNQKKLNVQILNKFKK